MPTLRLVIALALFFTLIVKAIGKNTAPSHHLQYERINLQSLDSELQALLHSYSMESPNLYFIIQDNAIYLYSTYQLSSLYTYPEAQLVKYQEALSVEITNTMNPSLPKAPLSLKLHLD